MFISSAAAFALRLRVQVLTLTPSCKIFKASGRVPTEIKPGVVHAVLASRRCEPLVNRTLLGTLLCSLANSGAKENVNNNCTYRSSHTTTC
jgi:hypothetical protein